MLFSENCESRTPVATSPSPCTPTRDEWRSKTKIISIFCRALSVQASLTFPETEPGPILLSDPFRDDDRPQEFLDADVPGLRALVEFYEDPLPSMSNRGTSTMC